MPYGSEPSWDDTFLLPLPIDPAATPPDPDAPMTAKGEKERIGRGLRRANALLKLKAPIHVLVLQRRGGEETVLSSLLVEWRKVLQSGRCVISVELPGLGEQAKVPVGSLELRLELLPALRPSRCLAEAEVLLALKHERTLEADAERGSSSAARSWCATARRRAAPALPPEGTTTAHAPAPPGYRAAASPAQVVRLRRAPPRHRSRQVKLLR